MSALITVVTVRSGVAAVEQVDPGMVVRSKLDAATNLQWQNSLDVLDLFFGFDPRSRRPLR